jgi:hypothetical protein
MFVVNVLFNFGVQLNPRELLEVVVGEWFVAISVRLTERAGGSEAFSYSVRQVLAQG